MCGESKPHTLHLQRAIINILEENRGKILVSVSANTVVTHQYWRILWWALSNERTHKLRAKNIILHRNSLKFRFTRKRFDRETISNHPNQSYEIVKKMRDESSSIFCCSFFDSISTGTECKRNSNIRYIPASNQRIVNKLSLTLLKLSLVSLFIPIIK